MPDLPSTPLGTAAITTPPANYRYPNDLGLPPFDKWILFRAKSGRHLVRNQILPDKGGNADMTLASVALYLSGAALATSIAAQWDTTNLDDPFKGAAIELLAQTAKQIGDAKLGQMLTDGSFWETIGATLMTRLKSFTSGASVPAMVDAAGELFKADVAKSATALLGPAVGIALGQKPNPRTDIFFDALQYRTYELTFMLVPRDIQEAQNIDRIINFFQFYMLPSYGGNEATDAAKLGSFMMGYPYEFEVSMHDGTGRRLNHVNQIGRCVVTSCKIDHAGGGKTAFVKSQGDYYPVVTNLSVSLSEVRLLDRNSKEIERPVAPLLDPNK